MAKNSIKVGINERTYKRLLKRYSNMQYGKELDYCIPKYYDYNLSGFTYFDIKTIKNDYMSFVKFVINKVDIMKDDLEEPVLPDNHYIEKDEGEVYLKGILESKHVSTMHEIIKLCIYYGIGYVYYKTNKLDEKIKDYKKAIIDICIKEYLPSFRVQEYVFNEILNKYNNEEDKYLINDTIFSIERFVNNWVDDEIHYLMNEDSEQISNYISEVYYALIVLGEVFSYNYLDMK